MRTYNDRYMTPSWKAKRTPMTGSFASTFAQHRHTHNGTEEKTHSRSETNEGETRRFLFEPNYPARSEGAPAFPSTNGETTLSTRTAIQRSTPNTETKNLRKGTLQSLKAGLLFSPQTKKTVEAVMTLTLTTPRRTLLFAKLPKRSTRIT